LTAAFPAAGLVILVSRSRRRLDHRPFRTHPLFPNHQRL